MKIVALAYNFPGLQNEKSKHPFFFLKNPDSIIGPTDDIRILERWHVWAEVELALRIGVNHEDHHLFDAVAVANDVTAKSVEGRDVHLALSKGMDTFLPMSEWVTEFDLDWIMRYASMYQAINYKRIQTGKLRHMIHVPSAAYYYISSFMSFNPGDILLMGTCYHTHYPLRDGDVVQTDILIDDPDMDEFMVGITNNRVVEYE